MAGEFGFHERNSEGVAWSKPTISYTVRWCKKRVLNTDSWPLRKWSTQTQFWVTFWILFWASSIWGFDFTGSLYGTAVHPHADHWWTITGASEFQEQSTKTVHTRWCPVYITWFYIINPSSRLDIFHHKSTKVVPINPVDYNPFSRGYPHIAGWWFGTFGLVFHRLGKSSSQLTNSIIFQRGRYTTNQICINRYMDINPINYSYTIVIISCDIYHKP